MDRQVDAVLPVVSGSSADMVCRRHADSDDARVIAVLVNSLYSFWWDITNDWGLSLLTPEGWSASPAVSYSFVSTPAAGHHRPAHLSAAHRANSSHGRARSVTHHASVGNGLGVPGISEPPPPSRPHSPTMSGIATPSKVPHAHVRNHHSRAFSTAASPNVTFPFLRPILLLPDPVIYYLAVGVDLVLRFTWSLKLSSHLHSIHEVESGVFLMEALEVVRRWMWVYLRIEWEAVRKGGGGFLMDKSEGELRLRAEEESVEMSRRENGGFVDEEDALGEEDQVGLGIHVQVTRDVKG